MSYVMEERVFIAIVIKYSFISHQNIHTGEKPFKYYQDVKTISIKVSFVNNQIIDSGGYLINVISVMQGFNREEMYIFLGR